MNIGNKYQQGYYLHHKVKSGRRRRSPRDMYRSGSRGLTVKPRTSESDDGFFRNFHSTKKDKNLGRKIHISTI